MEAAAAVVYVGWDEVTVSSDRGRREVHYYLSRTDGESDLAVIGKEKSLRHMSYHYALRNRSFFLSLAPPLKLKSRREVVDWLNSIVSDPSPHEAPYQTTSFDGSDYSGMNVGILKDIQWTQSCYSSDFLWLGYPWTCRKRRKHYQSFSRRGVKISVHNFIYVLAEKDKRLVAYLEDMYEDSKGNKMIVVRWFHKTDEVGIVLPHYFSDREIFFSLCLQDLSIECVDGLAAVLSPQHFEKFLNDARHTKLNPFVCCKLFENDDIKPFDITQVKGYWKQEILRYMYTACPSRDQPKSQKACSSLNGLENEKRDAVVRPRPWKRLRRSKDYENNGKESMETTQQMHNNGLNNNKIETGICIPGGEEFSVLLSAKDAKQSLQEYLQVGSEVEVLSQDSGIRGCWFRASIIKKHKDKLKVRYQDINDAADETKKLEEWILASKVAAPDELGMRINGRGIIRPFPQSQESGMSLVVDVGIAVDAWWQDTWREGVIVQKDCEDRIHVYFPGEKQESVFSRNCLRPSLEWLRNGWTHISKRPDILTCLPSSLERKQDSANSGHNSLAGVSGECNKDAAGCDDSSQVSGCSYEGKQIGVVLDLSKDNILTQLRWSSSKKRRRVSAASVLKVCHSHKATLSDVSRRFVISTSMKADSENCKYTRDSLFNSAMVQPLTSLVMSR